MFCFSPLSFFFSIVVCSEAFLKKIFISDFILSIKLLILLINYFNLVIIMQSYCVLGLGNLSKYILKLAFSCIYPYLIMGNYCILKGISLDYEEFCKLISCFFFFLMFMTESTLGMSLISTHSSPTTQFNVMLII